MEKKRLLLGLTLVIAILAVVSISLADIPPPPADQNLGLYDTVAAQFAEEDCRDCHSSGLPDRHHGLVSGGEYECLDCHPVGPGGGGVAMIRDCTNSSCHTASPHHETQDALDRHCSACHGSLVDDYDDGHFIPPYASSLVTPDTSYKVQNETTGKKWGGCEGCHEADPMADPEIMDNWETHHNLGSISNNCDICHIDSLLDIRTCEDCHGVKSLHNIQYDYANTSDTLGYGHIGANWDCNGCHAFWEPSSGTRYSMSIESFGTSGIGPLVPSGTPVPGGAIDSVSSGYGRCPRSSIESLNYGESVAGEATVVTINGNNFDASAEVVITNENEIVATVTPDCIAPTELLVTILLPVPGNYRVKVVTRCDMDSITSNSMPLAVEHAVTIDLATIEGDNVLIYGSGFGEYGSGLSVIIGGNIISGGGVISWDDTQIEVHDPDANVGDSVTVNGLYGPVTHVITA